jgi:hypothetical protein
MVDLAETILQDAGIDPGGSANQVFAAAELQALIPDALETLSRYCYYSTIETYQMESRTGTATSTSASHLVDATEAQFASTDVGKIVYNSTDRTWAQITAYTSTSDITLSKDIFISGEQYEIYNAGCRNKKQINISSISHLTLEPFVEYPIGYRRNYGLFGDILEIDINWVDDTKNTDAYKDALVYVRRPHFLSQLTDFAAAVNLEAGYAAGSTSIILDSLQSSGTIVAGQPVTFASTRGTYHVTADATISGNAATITIFPGLESAISDDCVVTLKNSTLTPHLEELLAQLLAGKAAMSKSRLSIGQNTFGKDNSAQMYDWGRAQESAAIISLKRLMKPVPYVEYSRG